MKIKQEIRRAANKYGVPPGILVAQIGAESAFNVNARSPAGASGIAQFIDSTAKAYGVNNRDSNPLDDIDGAARYMRDNLKRTGGNVSQALSIYNSGRPDGYLSIPETKNYVAKILGAAGNPGKIKVPKGSGAGAGATTTPVYGNPGQETVQDPELQRKQFFAQWFAKQDPNSPLVKLGVLDPNMATTKTVSTPASITGLKVTGGVQAAASSPATRVSTKQLRPGGGWAGTEKLLVPFEAMASKRRLTKSSGKRSTVMTSSGNVSDHATVSKLADAGDFAGGVADMDGYAKDLQKRLGLRDWKGVQSVNKQIGNHVYRFQMLYRTMVGGDHFTHVHLGIKRVS